MTQTQICKACHKNLPLTEYTNEKRSKTGKKSICRSCRAEQNRAREDKKSPEERAAARMAANLCRRVKNSHHYIKNGIENRLGTQADIRAHLLEHYTQTILFILASGEKPTIDRIDPAGHYEPNNIRVISQRENSVLGTLATIRNSGREVVVQHIKTGHTAQFPSISTAARYMDMYQGTLSGILRMQEQVQLHVPLGKDKAYYAWLAKTPVYK